MNVFELSMEQERLEAAIEAAGGELFPELEAMLHLLSNAKSDKLQALVKLIKKTDADDMVIDHEIVRLRTLQKTNKTKREQLERLVKVILVEGEKWQDGADKISWRESKSVEVVEGVVLPDVYYRTKIVTEVDKVKLGADLKGGAVVPGASLVTKLNLQVR